MNEVASEAGLWYNAHINIVDHSDAGNILRSGYIWFRRCIMDTISSTPKSSNFCPTCGKVISPRSTYCSAHYPRTPEARAKYKAHWDDPEWRSALLEKRSHALSRPEVKQRTSEARRGNKNALGFKHSEETKRRFSETRKGHPAHQNQIDAVIETNKRRTGQTRKPFSEEHRQRLGERQKALWANPEWRAKRTKQIRDNFETPEALEKMRRNVTAHWETLSHEQRLERVTPGITASFASNPSSIEIIVRGVLEASGTLFEEQKQIGPYFVDFFLPEKKTVVEAMGCFWHGCLTCGHDTEKDKKARAKDKKRDAYLRKCGYEVYHIWEHDIRKGVMDVVEALL